MRRTSGFTLVEILIVVAIVGILARFAIPAYSRYTQRGDLVEGTQALSQYRVQMEQFYQDNHAYYNTGAPVAFGAGFACGIAPPVLVNFTLTCVGSNAGQTYLATATANAASPIAGFVYTIDQNNNQLTTGTVAGWTAVALPATSWITR